LLDRLQVGDGRQERRRRIGLRIAVVDTSRRSSSGSPGVDLERPRAAAVSVAGMIAGSPVAKMTARPFSR
jgi:hypothetical protein